MVSKGTGSGSGHELLESERIDHKIRMAAIRGRWKRDHPNPDCGDNCPTCVYLDRNDLLESEKTTATDGGVDSCECEAISLKFDTWTSPGEVLDRVCLAVERGQITPDRARSIHSEHVDRLKQVGKLLI